MANLFKSHELAKRFNVPKQTMYNWSRADGTWRKQLYVHLEKIYAKELAEKAKGL